MSSTFFAAASELLTRLLAVLSVYYLLRGHDAPGGGFVGGLVLAAALALRMYSHGPAATRELLRIEPRTLIAAGLAIALVAAAIGLVARGTPFAPLEVGTFANVGPIGTALLFDVGVYVVVAGATLAILFSLFEEEEAS